MTNIGAHKGAFISTEWARGGFGAEFFKPYSTTAVDRVSTVDKPTGPRTSYSEDRYGSHARFCKSRDFAKYRKEVRQDLDALIDFCRRNNVPDTQAIADSFNLFFAHRFEPTHYFDTHEKFVDSAGKRSLDNFRALIGNNQFTLEKRVAAIRNLSKGVTDCATGAVSNLIMADRDLDLSVGGLRATLWKAKEELARAILQDELAREQKGNRLLANNEVHYVNTLWNQLAPWMGFDKVPDCIELDIPFLAKSCYAKLIDAMTPDKLAGIIADQLLATFTDKAAMHPDRLSGPCSTETTEKFLEIVNNIRRTVGLGEDSLPLHAFVLLDDSGTSYRLRADPSIIALHLLKAMHDERLLTDFPTNAGEWLDGQANRLALFTYGKDLAWQVRLAGPQPASASLADSDKTTEDALWKQLEQADPITVKDLHAWRRANGGGNPPPSAIRQILRCVPSADLYDIDARWLGTAASILEVLGRLDAGQAEPFLKANLHYLQTGFPESERDALLDKVFAYGDETALALASAWCPDPWQLALQARAREQSQDSETRMERWMRQGDERSIDAFRRLVANHRHSDDEEMTDISAKVYRALEGDSPRPAIYRAMTAGNVGAIAAWHRLLCEPTVLNLVKDRLPSLVAGMAGSVPALAKGIGRGHLEAVNAYVSLLTDPALVPYLGGNLGRLLAARTLDGTPLQRASRPMMRRDQYAVNTAAFEVYRAYIGNPLVLPHIRNDLDELLIPNNEVLARTLDMGDFRAVRAYRDCLTHPDILPQIRNHLHRLVIKDDDLTGALFYGSWQAVQEYHALIADPAISSPLMAAALSKIRLQSSAGVAGLTTVMNHCDVRLIRAFHALLKDQSVNPNIQNVLPKFFVDAEDRPGPLKGLFNALERGDVDAVKACHELLADSGILPPIGRFLPDLLSAAVIPPTGRMRGRGSRNALLALRDMVTDRAFEPYLPRDAVDSMVKKIDRRTRWAAMPGLELPSFPPALRRAWNAVKFTVWNIVRR